MHGPSLPSITKLAVVTSGSEVYSGNNKTAHHSGTVSVTLTTSTTVAIKVLITSNTQAYSGGLNYSNVQSTYIQATRIG